MANQSKPEVHNPIDPAFGIEVKTSVTRISAKNLVRKVVTAVGADPDEKQGMTDIALAVDGWLKAQGTSGRWDLVNVKAVLASGLLPIGSDPERGLFFLTTLVGFAGINELMSPQKAKGVLADIERVAIRQVTRDFARDTSAQLEVMIS